MTKYLISALILFCTSPALAVTDWTNYLKGMQNECNYPNKTLQKKSTIPKSLHKSIIKYSTQIGADEQKSVDIRLKEATAFGKPITRIVLDNTEFGSSTFHVYFKDGNFAKLKPKFFVKVNGKNYTAGERRAWQLDGSYDDKSLSNPKALSIPYRGNNSKNYRKLVTDDSNGMTFWITHDNGWWRSYLHGADDDDYIFSTGLDFDSKNKRISCYSYFT